MNILILGSISGCGFYLRGTKKIHVIHVKEIVLLPYSPTIYSGRTSGVLIEAINCGIPIIVSRNTWLEKIAQEFATGSTCEFGNPRSLIEAIKFVFENHPSSLDEVISAGIISSQLNNFSSLSLKLIQIREDLNSLRFCVFYPWGASEAHSSGSGSRLILLIKYLKEQGHKVVIYCEGFSTTTIEGTQTKNLFLEKSVNSNIHIAMHTGRVLQSQKSQILKDVSNADVVIFEGTHLVLPVSNLVKSDLGKRVIVISHDLLKASNEETNSELEELQLSALRKGESFSVSKDEAEYFSSLGINCGYSPLPTRNILGGGILAKSYGQVVRHLVSESEKLVLFVGSKYGPNIEALDFIKDLSRKFALSNPEVKFLVVGSVSEPSEEENLICLGRVSALLLDQLYLRSDLVISPIFSGQGSPSKTIEALSRGCKVLSTSKGSRGLNLIDFPNLFVQEVDGGEKMFFVNQMIQLLDSEYQFDFKSIQIHAMSSVFSSLLPFQMTSINSEQWRTQDDLLIEAINDQEFFIKCFWTEELLKILESSSKNIEQKILFGYFLSIIEIDGDFISFLKSENLSLSPVLFQILNQCKDRLSYEAGQKFERTFKQLEQEYTQNLTPKDLENSDLGQSVYLGELIRALYSRIIEAKYFKIRLSDKSIDSLSKVKAKILRSLKRWVLANSYLRLRPTFFWKYLLDLVTRKT